MHLQAEGRWELLDIGDSQSHPGIYSVNTVVGKVGLEVPSSPFAINSLLFLAQASTNLSLEISFACSRISYKGNHTDCSLVGLASFTQYYVFEIY